jgi:nitroreductase
MKFFEAVHHRHSYRGAFSPETLHQAELVEIVEAGLAAPSGKNCQTTQFVIIDDPEMITHIRGMHASNKALQQAAAFIACIIDREPEKIYEGYSFQVEDCAAAVENMLLAVTAMGYGSVWIDGWLRIDGHAEEIGGLIALPDSKVIRVLLPVGIPAETYHGPKKKPFEERAWFNTYKG